MTLVQKAIDQLKARVQRTDLRGREDLERERMAHAPVLGREGWYTVLGYSVVRLLAVDILTQAGLWVIATTWMGMHLALRAFELPGGPSENLKWLLYGFGAHSVLAWLYWCARDQAKNLLSAAADWIRGRTKPNTNQAPGAPAS